MTNEEDKRFVAEPHGVAREHPGEPRVHRQERLPAMTVYQRATQWIVSRDVGTSSRTIWSVMQMVEPDDHDTPSDSDDFGRCYRLLKLIPEWRENLTLVAYRYPSWAPLIREWDRLTVMYENGQRAAMYDVMLTLRDEGLVLCGWNMTSRGCGTGPGRGHTVKKAAIDKALSADARFTPVDQGKA